MQFVQRLQVWWSACIFSMTVIVISLYLAVSKPTLCIIELNLEEPPLHFPWYCVSFVNESSMCMAHSTELQCARLGAVRRAWVSTDRSVGTNAWDWTFTHLNTKVCPELIPTVAAVRSTWPDYFAHVNKASALCCVLDCSQLL